MTENFHLPKDIGCVIHPETRAIVNYFVVDEWGEQTSDYCTGGVMTQRIKTGRKTYEAREVGSTTLLELTPALRAEIELDLSRRGIEI